MNNLMVKIWVSAATGARSLVETKHPDRGAGAVETAIVVGLVAAAAATLAGLMVTAISNYGDKIPQG